MGCACAQNTEDVSTRKSALIEKLLYEIDRLDQAEVPERMQDMLIVLNHNDEASRAIARKLRSMRICCKIADANMTPEEIAAQQPLGIVIASGSGGDALSIVPDLIHTLGLPILALGEAASVLLEFLGGNVGGISIENAVNRIEYRHKTLLDGLEASEHLLRNVRQYTLNDPNIAPICLSENTVIGYAAEEKCVYGLQIPVEQNDPDLSAILSNFALLICGCTTWWNDEMFVERAVGEISSLTGDGRAVCAMTGGLNSGVSALLAYRALGDKLRCIFIDTGLLREGEGDDVMRYYHHQVGIHVVRVNAEERFLSALVGVTDAMEKNRIIGRLIQEILDEEMRRIGEYTAIIRGTTQNDLMFHPPQATKPTALRASDNVPIIEPVRELFKDEVRKVGDFLGLPGEIVSRQPFPGSGLASRIIGEVTAERLRTLRSVDHIFRSEIARSNIAKRLWQFFAVLTPMPGEKRDGVCLRAVHASESALAYAARLPYDTLESVVSQITAKHPEIHRIVYDLTPSNHYQGIEWQ